MKFERYSEYKDSGIDWLDDIPSEWKVKRLKDVALLKYSNVDKKSYDNQSNVLLCNYVDVYKNDFIINKINFMMATASLEQIKKFTIKKYDVLFTKDSEAFDDNANPCLIIEDFNNLVCGYHLAQVRTNTQFLIAQYLFRLLQAANYNYYFSIHSKGITRVGLSINSANDVQMFLPSTNIQTKIANYLDTQTTQIDQKVALLEQKIQKYQELKQTLINETVLRGLDKTTPLKNSGIEWIGDIPKHWEIKRINNAFNEKSIKVSDSDYQPLSVTMRGIVPQLKNVAKTMHNDNRKLVISGDYVINSRSDRRGSSGISAMNGSVSVINIVLTPKKYFFGRYLHHLFRSYLFIEEFFKNGTGIAYDLWTTKYSLMRSIEFAHPRFAEQTKIANYLDEKTNQIDAIIKATQTQIATLTEFRKTLINDAVTGKIKVA